jgi:hypothetical protein
MFVVHGSLSPDADSEALVENSDPVLIALFLVIMPAISVLLLVWAKRKGWW